MTHKVAIREVSEDSLGIVEAWIKGGDIGHVIDDVIPNEFHVEATYDEDHAICLSEPVECNGNIITKFEL